MEGQGRGIQGSEEQQPIGVTDHQTSVEDQDQDIRNDTKYFQDLAYNCQTQIEHLIIQREEMNKKYECQAKLLAQASPQEMSRVEMLATQHYTEMLEAQQQKATAVEEHMLEKSNSGKQSTSMGA